ncbi:MAG: redoxin domain-containing protein [Planctomycetes bacterium]|nr:redoxin domain-containing protein [Planctomycetota bacterium]MBL7145311.1 redoxin domain-containing protein [Phycisphaerae bacterium]
MSRNRKQTLTILAVVLVMVGQSWSAQKQYKSLEIGQKAPDFNLPGVDGRNYKLADFADADVLVIIFHCNHCPTAQAYEERIKKLASDYKKPSVALVAISPNDPKAVRLDELGYSDMGDSFEDMKIRAKDMRYNFPYLYDGEDQKVSLAYGPARTPHVYIFDRQRTLRYMGRVDDAEKPHLVKIEDARNAIEALLKGRKVSVEETPTIGCSIKWADKRESARQSLELWAREKVTVEMADTKSIKELIKNDSGKLRLVNIWASWSGPSVKQLQEYVTINRMYRNRDLELITISADSPKRRNIVLSSLKKQQVSCKNLLFDSEDEYELMAAVDKDLLGGIPYTILIQPDGKVIYRKVGMIDPLEVKKAIVGYVGRYYK